MKKTPVSILQEMMVKKGETPNYQLIYNGGGTHDNTFIFQVSCEGLTASGTGRCKKDAKHEAATAMLEAIANQKSLPQLPASPCESPQPTRIPVSPKSSTNIPFRNTIGELQELCLVNTLDDPQYKETGNTGPAHAKVFTVQCLVSTFIEEGVATTKKQAKHEAARKMIDRIIGVVADGQINNFRDSIGTKEERQSKIAMARYPSLSVVHNETVKSKVNWGIRIRNYHESFKEKFSVESKYNLLEKLANLCFLLNQFKNNENDITQLKEEFENILKFIEIQFHYIQFPCDSKNDPVFLLGIYLNTAPDICEIGLGKTEIEAQVNSIEKIVDLLKFLLK